MAVGDPVGHIINSSPPGSSINRADPDVILATTSEENFPVLLYDDSLVESYDLLGAMFAWNGTSDVQFEWLWCTIGVPNNTVQFDLEVRRINAGSIANAAFDYTASPQIVVAPQASAQLTWESAAVTFTAAQLNGLQNRERFNLRFTRNDTGSQLGDVAVLWPAIAITEA